MTEQTRFVTLAQLSERDRVRVLRVRTKSGSSYTVGLLPGARRTAILRGRAADGSQLEVRDPDGQLDDRRSLFDVDPQGWVGFGLEVGSIATSRLVAAEDEEDEREVTAVRGALGGGPENPVVRSRPAPSITPRIEAPAARAVPTAVPAPRPEALGYPEDHVAELEVAASYLRRAYRKRELLDDLEAHGALKDRFEVALSECALMLQALGRRVREREGRAPFGPSSRRASRLRRRQRPWLRAGWVGAPFGPSSRCASKASAAPTPLSAGGRDRGAFRAILPVRFQGFGCANALSASGRGRAPLGALLSARIRASAAATPRAAR